MAYQYISIYWLQILETSTAICITDRSRYISYLTNRSQSVCVNGIVSEPQKIDLGVPQGSALGPLLFIMYINDIPHGVRYSNVEQYADDTLLYFASDDVNIVESNRSSDLDIVTLWLSANYLILNSTKSKIMLVGTHQRLASKSFSISSNGRDLEGLEKFKYQGVFMDPTLS